MLRDLCVERRKWITASEFEDALAACNLLPGPASTQMAIYCALRVGGRPGALLGGACFIAPGLIAILALAAAFLASDPPAWLSGAGAGAGAAVAAVALRAGMDLARPSLARLPYLAAGVVAAAAVGPYVVLVLLACGAIELARQRPWTAAPALLPLAVATGSTAALCWTAFKVGALSYGGGFVIVPLMHGDAVETHHWMTDGQFLNAVALGQVTPGPVTHTVAVVGYAASGIAGGLLAALIAFAPSFVFVLLGADRFHELLRNASARAFIDGAGPAALGAILGSAIPLAAALEEWWQFAILAGAAVALLLLRRGIVETLLVAGLLGALSGL